MSDSLKLHGLQCTRLLWPPLPPKVCSDSCPLSWWCYLIISSSVTPFFCLQSFPASGSFQWVSSSHQVAKVLELQQQSCSEYSGSISFRIDWFDLLTVQGTLQGYLLFPNKHTEISVQFNSVAQSCPTVCDSIGCSTPSFPVHHNSRSLLKYVHQVDVAIQPSHPLLSLLLLPSTFLRIRVFSNESALHIR